VHDVEAFGPVSTLMPYDDFDEALALAARGKGRVTTLATRDPAVAAAVPRLEASHGRTSSTAAAPSPPATARRCLCSSGPGQPVAAKSWKCAGRHALSAAHGGARLAHDAP
jgi:oxepin-CoA hydrolase/3-oxo-5,6-dehydrosuberyl-CoA semialdehyde dehydrogenase